MSNQKLTLGFSPCPNDTFIFDALIHHKIDTEGLDFELQLLDVEELNNKAVAGELDITKLSYHAFAYVSQQYILLNSGSALGQNCGPLLVALNSLSKKEIENGAIAIPGKLTTANFLFSLEYPNAKNKKAVLFSDIEQGVLSGKFDAGVIIHENRFTYEEKGLTKICDLGERWEATTGFPIPLGGIAIKRDLDIELQRKVDRLIRKSIAFAFQHKEEPLNFMRQHAQEMEEEVMYKHVNLYVNDYSIDLGEKGKNAIEFLYKKGVELELFQPLTQPVILEH
ncbi:MAG: 1,4-dihydroxy-6-naphthoate synthase [Chitinophagales bacterium]